VQKDWRRLLLLAKHREAGALVFDHFHSFRKRVESAIESTKSDDTPLLKVVKTIVPTNIFHSIGGRETPDMLGLMFFAVFLGICVTMVPKETAAPLIGVLDAVFAATTVAAE
jgi:Na+/H+-dicarboxylate symporter